LLQDIVENKNFVRVRKNLHFCIYRENMYSCSTQN